MPCWGGPRPQKSLQKVPAVSCALCCEEGGGDSGHTAHCERCWPCLAHCVTWGSDPGHRDCCKRCWPCLACCVTGGSDPGHRARCGRVPTLSHTLCCKGGGDPGHRARCGKVPTLSHTLCCKGGGHKARWSDVLALPGTLRCKGWPCPMLTGRKHPWTMISLYNTAL